MSKILKEGDRHWRNKWQLLCNVPSQRRLFINSGVWSLRQFCYEQTFRVLENFLMVKRKSKSLDGSRIIEVGCGSGTTSINIMKSYPGARMYMIDISFDAICVARKNISEENLGAFLVVADANMLPFKDRVFSTVFSIGLLEHITDPTFSITEQCRLLKNNGLLMALVVPVKFSVDNFISPFYQFIRKITSREKKLLRSFQKTLASAFGPQKATPSRNALLDDYYKKVISENVGMDDIKCVYINPFFTSIKSDKILSVVLLYIYIGITKFRKTCLFQKMPFSAHKSIAKSFFLSAYKKD